ncbi:uncharacterized protein LOC119323885 isoform X4 [Triticum dicoccoides]|uniref:uncharacterized protein LOC119323885 isoform X4 n=1 Tax=Triticum dicoccoides TaxID=85692 RepID=UPI001891DEE1|nr:uncharacterized protein LOC119323885 isoform X4 [Triticum dicoccoides]XP_044388500.1 uncharacterized protein LOC123111707 isoform X2 [Triticum aestivum]
MLYFREPNLHHASSPSQHRGTRNGYMRHSVSVGVSQSTTQESAHLLSKNTDVGSRRKYVTWLSQPRNMVVGQETEAAATKSQRTFLLNRLKPRGGRYVILM